MLTIAHRAELVRRLAEIVPNGRVIHVHAPTDDITAPMSLGRFVAEVFEEAGWAVEWGSSVLAWQTRNPTIYYSGRDAETATNLERVFSNAGVPIIAVPNPDPGATAGLIIAIP